MFTFSSVNVKNIVFFVVYLMFSVLVINRTEHLFSSSLLRHFDVGRFRIQKPEDCYFFQLSLTPRGTRRALAQFCRMKCFYWSRQEKHSKWFLLFFLLFAAMTDTLNKANKPSEGIQFPSQYIKQKTIGQKACARVCVSFRTSRPEDRNYWPTSHILYW